MSVRNKYQKGRSNIKKLGSVLKEWLNNELSNKVINLAKKLYEAEHIYVIGKHLNYPGSLNLPLRLKDPRTFTLNHLLPGSLNMELLR